MLFFFFSVFYFSFHIYSAGKANGKYQEMVLMDGRGNIQQYVEDMYDIHARMIWGTACPGEAGSYFNTLSLTVDAGSEVAAAANVNSFDLTKEQKTFLHETLHAMGVKLHMNRIQCDPGVTTNWRDCHVQEYGNNYDVLGTVNSPMTGLSSFARYRLGFMPTKNIRVVDQALNAADSITLAPIGFDATTALPAMRSLHRMALVTPAADGLYCMPFITIEYRDNSGFDKHLGT